jgi:hypothetical protein
MSIPTRITFKHIKNVIISANKTTLPTPLGRWKLNNNVGLVSDYSNIDNCGTCGEYLHKKQLDNKEKDNSDQHLYHEYSSLLVNTPN